MIAPELKGLVAAGGYSRRMGRDKVLISYHGVPQAVWTYRLLSEFCTDTLLSCRADQNLGEAEILPRIHDRIPDSGALEGLLAAHAAHPFAAWLFVACDLPKLTPQTLGHLIAQRDPDAIATAFISDFDGLPEPLCTIYEPSAFPILLAAAALDFRCPRKILIQNAPRVRLIELPDPDALDNINHPHEAEAFLNASS